MNVVKTSPTILQLREKDYLWRQFLSETRDRGLITRAVDLLRAGKGDRLVTENLTAYQLAEPEAQAWLSYFRGIGAIAPAGKTSEES